MLTAIYFIVIILGLLFNKSKLVRVLQYICIYIIFVFNSWSQDDIVYRRIYAGYYGASHEPGFDFLCQICYKNGIQYEVFKFFYVSVAIILLLLAFQKVFKNSSNRAYSLILLYPLLPFVELLRNLMAIAIVACGIAWYFSLKNEGLKEKIIFVLIILLGAAFHYNVLFFLILLLPNEKRPQKSTYFKIILLSITSIVICNLPIFRRVLALVFDSKKILSWFDSSNRIGLGIIIVLAFHIISFGIYDFIYRTYYFRMKRGLEYNNNENIISKKVYSLNLYSFALMGLYTYNMEFFSRLYIFILLLNCFHVSIIAKKIKSKNIYILSFIQVLYHLGMFVFFCQPFNEQGIMAFILQNNYLFP